MNDPNDKDKEQEQEQDNDANAEAASDAMKHTCDAILTEIGGGDPDWP